MNIAIFGANTPLLNIVATELYHRKNAITLFTNNKDEIKSDKYTIKAGNEAFDESLFDITFDIEEDHISVKHGEKETKVYIPKNLDIISHSTGEYALSSADSAKDGSITARDLAIAAADAISSDEAALYPVSGAFVPPPQDGSSQMRYTAYSHKGLMGRTFHLLMDSGDEYALRFIKDDTLTLSKLGEYAKTYSCKCLMCDKDVWLVSFIKGSTCITLILDDAQNLVTAHFAAPAENCQSFIRHSFLFGAIIKYNCETPFRRHGFTDELVGEKVTMHYSPYIDITHCYVSESYVRDSLCNMKPLPEDAPEAVIKDTQSRQKRWSTIFFEEPAQYIRINPHLYLVAITESTRNRIDKAEGGGDMVYALNTRIMKNFGRAFNFGSGTADFSLISVYGDWYDINDPIETAKSPYLV